MSFLYMFAIFAFLFLCFILTVTVLVQEGKGGGLGTSFGGEAADSLFGTSTPDILKKFTAWLGVAFVFLCLLLSFWTSSLMRHQVSSLPQDETELTK